MDLHRLLGHAALALILFRLFWGFAGSSTARFAQFVKGPFAVLRYLRKEEPPALGHNPLGAWSVLLLLGLLALETTLGLFAQDTDGIESGPLTPLVSYDTADAARGWHSLVFDLLVSAIAVHVAAILFYLVVKRDNLVAPMVTGTRKVAAPPATPPRMAPPWRAAVGALAAAAIAFWVSRGCPV